MLDAMILDCAVVIAVCSRGVLEYRVLPMTRSRSRDMEEAITTVTKGHLTGKFIKMLIQMSRLGVVSH